MQRPQAPDENLTMGLVVETRNQAGVLHELTGVIARAGGNITCTVQTGANAGQRH